MMEIPKESFVALLEEHEAISGQHDADWIFNFMGTSKSDTDFTRVVGALKGMQDLKESDVSETMLVVTPNEGGPSLVVHGVDAMSKYCMNEAPVIVANPEWRSLELHASHLLPDNLGMSVRSDVINATKGTPFENDVWLAMLKYYRIEKSFDFECSTCTYRVKMIRESSDSYATMKQSRVMNAEVSISYELSWKRKPVGKNDFMEIISHIARFVQVITNNPILISKERINKVKSAYKALIAGHVEKTRKKFRAAPGGHMAGGVSPSQVYEQAQPVLQAEEDDLTVLAPKPITLEQRHLVVPSPETYGSISILKGYCVTDKADGERMLLYIDKDGEAFFINNTADIRPASFRGGEDVRNTILDGEYISLNKRKDNVQLDLFAAFDIFFLRGEPVYRLPLVSKLENTRSRYKLLQSVCDTKNWTHNKTKIHELSHKIHSYAEGAEMHEACKAILSKANGRQLPYSIDGLVFTPADLGVCAFYSGRKDTLFSAHMKWELTLKWKPPEQNTIDFLVEAPREAAMIRNQQTGKMYRRFLLYTGYAKLRSEPISVKEGLRLRYDEAHADMYGLGRRRNQNSEMGDYTKRVFSPVSYMRKDVGQVLVPQECTFVQNNTIVEFGYDLVKQEWIPHRLREDKTRIYQQRGTMSKTANDFMVASSIWRSIHEPVTIEMLSGSHIVHGNVVPNSLEERVMSVDDVYYAREVPRHHMLSVNMLNFHNNGVKRALYRNYSPNISNKNLLELACGKAGDFARWTESNFKFILGVDLSSDNITKAGDGAYARILNNRERLRQFDPVTRMSSYTNIVFVIGDCAKNLANGECTDDPDSKEVLATIYQSKTPNTTRDLYRHIRGQAAKRFAMVSCQFAIHYFFKDEKTLDGFLANVADNLANGGVFITTFMDGSSVDALLQKTNGKAEGRKPGYEGFPVWAILKRYDAFATPVIEGTSAVGAVDNVYGKRVSVYLENTGQLISEYLVHEGTLISKLESLGIETVDSKLFEHTFNQCLRDPTKPKVYYDVKQMENDEVQKQFSFLNRWMVFRKKTI